MLVSFYNTLPTRHCFYVACYDIVINSTLLLVSTNYNPPVVSPTPSNPFYCRVVEKMPGKKSQCYEEEWDGAMLVAGCEGHGGTPPVLSTTPCEVMFQETVIVI